MEHCFDYCRLCETVMVRCGECGNNCCNATYGKDGTCPSCPSAYELQDKNWALQEKYREARKVLHGMGELADPGRL